MIWVWMAVAGGVGAVARAVLAPRMTMGRLSGVSVVNLIGTALLVALIGAGASSDALFVAGVGFLGSFTTFSTWMLEIIDRSVSNGADESLSNAALVGSVAVLIALFALLA